jgi:hypothetical protein
MVLESVGDTTGSTVLLNSGGPCGLDSDRLWSDNVQYSGGNYGCSILGLGSNPDTIPTMTAHVPDDILYIVLSTFLDYTTEPELVEHPILALSILRCESYGYPTEKQRVKRRAVLKQVCRRWRAIVQPMVDVTPIIHPMQAWT